MKRRWVAYVTWGKPPWDVEELDIDAWSATEARRLAEQNLRDNYKPGWEIISLEEKVTSYL